MSIKFGKWVRKRDDGTQVPLAPIRVTYYLTREDLENALITRVEPHYPDQLVEFTSKNCENAIREQMMLNADAINWWADNYQDVKFMTDELDIDEVEAWAQRQVSRMLGETEKDTH